MMVVGMTGGIGSGKSTAATLFAKHSVPIIDTDIIAREIVEPGMPAHTAIVEHFGNDICNDDETLNRARLKQCILQNDTDREYLETLLHPEIRASVIQKLEKLDGCYCIVVIPLLVEKGNYSMLHRTLVIDSTVDNQVSRAQQRDHMDIATIEAILTLQASREQRLARADDVIENNSRLVDLEAQVSKLHEKYMAICDQYP